MDELSEIDAKYKTDRGCNRNGHHYTTYYDSVLNKHRSTITRVLEIGIWQGESLKMWSDYFYNAEVYGIDIEYKGHLNLGSIKTFVLDQANKEDLKSFIEKIEKFDLIIDDGGHRMDQQQITLAYMLDHLNEDGIYILEDLHTSLPLDEQKCDTDFGLNEDGSNSTLLMLEQISNKEPYNENLHISKNEYENLLNKIDTIEIWNRKKTDGFISITSVIKIK